MDFNVISDGRKSFPINHGKTSDDTLLEVSGHLYMVFVKLYIPCNFITVLVWYSLQSFQWVGVYRRVQQMCPVLLFLNARTNSLQLRWRAILWHECRTVWSSSGPLHILIFDIRQLFIEMSPWQILGLWVLYSKFLINVAILKIAVCSETTEHWAFCVCNSYNTQSLASSILGSWQLNLHSCQSRQCSPNHWPVKLSVVKVNWFCSRQYYTKTAVFFTLFMF